MTSAGTVVALSLCLWSLLTVFRTPLRLFWKPGVAATEWGHWLGWISLLTAAVMGGLGASGWQIGPALVAATLFHLPLVRSLRMAPAIRRSIGRLGAEGSDTGVSSQPPPVVLSRLLHIPLPRMSPRRCVYREIDGQALALDLYESAPGRPPSGTLVVVVHGGSWSSGDSSQLSGMNRYLAGRGYTVAALNYRLAPQSRFPSPVDDICAAVRYLDAGGPNLPGGWEHVVLLGRSSGGHLALLAAYGGQLPLIHGVIALYAPTDLIWSWQRPAPGRLMDTNGAIRAFMGGSLSEMPERFDRASPIRLVRPDLPPTLLLHGGNDELVSPHQSRRLAAALEAAGAEQVHLELPWGKHGMDANLAGPGGQITIFAVEHFLRAVERSPQANASVDPAVP